MQLGVGKSVVHGIVPWLLAVAKEWYFPFISQFKSETSGIVHVHRRANDVLDAVQAANLVPERRLTALSRGEPKWQVLVCGTRRLAAGERGPSSRIDMDSWYITGTTGTTIKGVRRKNQKLIILELDWFVIFAVTVAVSGCQI